MELLLSVNAQIIDIFFVLLVELMTLLLDIGKAVLILQHVNSFIHKLEPLTGELFLGLF